MDAAPRTARDRAAAGAGRDRGGSSEGDADADADVGSSESTGVASVCGDTIVEGDEECDLGADNGEDQSCTPACKLAVCGDGFVRPELEPCDDGNRNDGDGCEADCSLPVCANGIADRGEACFEPGPPLDALPPARRVIAADLDGDGVLDLAALHREDESMSVLLGVGDGSFAAPLMLPGKASANDLDAGDSTATAIPIS